MNENRKTDESKAFASKNVEKIGVWLTFLGVLVTGFISFLNNQITNELKVKQISLSETQIEHQRVLGIIKSNIEQKDQDLSRLKFVKDLLPDAMSGEKKRSATFLTLVQLTLTDAEYEKLVLAMSSSQESNLRETGKYGLEGIETKQNIDANKIVNLVDQISSDDKAVRLKVMDEIYKMYKGSSKMLSAVLDYLAPASEKPLHVQGRINALFLLRNAEDAAWTAAHIQRAQEVLSSVESGAEKVGPKLGPQTVGVLRSVRRRIVSLQEAG